MSFFGSRSIHKNLRNQNKEKNWSKDTSTDLSETAAADELILDGFDVCMQGQMVMRERGMALKAKAKVNFGALIAPKLLKLEVGVEAEGSALGKKTLLVMCGTHNFGGDGLTTLTSADQRAALKGTAQPYRAGENPYPVMLACMDGWKFTGGAGASTAIGVGGKFGGASRNLEKAKSGESFKMTSSSGGYKDKYDSAVGKEGMDVVKAEAKYFAGLEAGVSGNIQRYYASDSAPIFVGKIAGDKNDVRIMIEGMLKEGTAKGALKDHVCKFISEKKPRFGGDIKYRRGFGRHTATSTIVDRLEGGLAKGGGGEVTGQARLLREQLKPWNGEYNPMHGLTFLYIWAKEGAYKLRVGASAEAAAIAPGVSVAFKAEANLIRLQGTGRGVHLKFQAPTCMAVGFKTEMYFQDINVTYKTFQRAVLEVSVDAEARLLGAGGSLAQFLEKNRKDPITGRGTDLVKLITALTKWHDLGARSGGLSVAVEAKTVSTMTYEGVCVFWDNPGRGELEGARGKSIEVNAKLGTGYVKGATFSLGNLANTIDVLAALGGALKDEGKFFRGEALNDADVKEAIQDKADLIVHLEKFHVALATNAALLDVSMTQFVDFLRGMDTLPHGIGQQVGEGTGVLLEATFSTQGSLDNALALEIDDSGDRSKHPPIASLSAASIESIRSRHAESRAADAPPKADVIRLRFRMGSNWDRSISVPIGFSFDDVGELGIEVKNVWNMEVEGIPVFYEKFSNPTLNTMNPTHTREMVVPPPLLFRT